MGREACVLRLNPAWQRRLERGCWVARRVAVREHPVMGQHHRRAGADRGHEPAALVLQSYVLVLLFSLVQQTALPLLSLASQQNIPLMQQIALSRMSTSTMPDHRPMLY